MEFFFKKNGKMVFILFQLQKGETNLSKYIDLID